MTPVLLTLLVLAVFGQTKVSPFPPTIQAIGGKGFGLLTYSHAKEEQMGNVHYLGFLRAGSPEFNSWRGIFQGSVEGFQVSAYVSSFGTYFNVSVDGLDTSGAGGPPVPCALFSFKPGDMFYPVVVQDWALLDATAFPQWISSVFAPNGLNGTTWDWCSELWGYQFTIAGLADMTATSLMCLREDERHGTLVTDWWIKAALPAVDDFFFKFYLADTGEGIPRPPTPEQLINPKQSQCVQYPLNGQ